MDYHETYSYKPGYCIGCTAPITAGKDWPTQNIPPSFSKDKPLLCADVEACQEREKNLPDGAWEAVHGARTKA